jgi:hypothetical protein
MTLVHGSPYTRSKFSNNHHLYRDTMPLNHANGPSPTVLFNTLISFAHRRGRGPFPLPNKIYPNTSLLMMAEYHMVLFLLCISIGSRQPHPLPRKLYCGSYYFYGMYMYIEYNINITIDNLYNFSLLQVKPSGIFIQRKSIGKPFSSLWCNNLTVNCYCYETLDHLPSSCIVVMVHVSALWHAGAWITEMESETDSRPR